jgi:hypothetical protein
MKVLPDSRGSRLRLGILVLILVMVLVWTGAWMTLGWVRYRPVEGDVLFQSLPSPRGIDVVEAIEGSTECPFSHCGVVVKKGGKWYVLEAMVPTVQEIPLKNWIWRNRGKFVAYRLKSPFRKHIPAWIEEMRERMGLAYDYRYRMEDDAIYCSELPFDGWTSVTGESMGKVVTLGSLKWEEYRAVIEEVEDIEPPEKLPLDREMITPRDLAKAPQLELVIENGTSVNGRW